MNATRKALIIDAINQLRPVHGYDLVPVNLILAQSALETGHWTSNLIETVNNAFGMKHPRVRPTTSAGATSAGFAIYPDLCNSVEDYLLRQKNFNIPNTANPVEYITATVNSGYAEDPNYASKWLALYNQFQGTSVPPGPFPPGQPNDNSATQTAILLGIAAIAVYYLTRK